MTVEHWQQVQELFHSALERAPGDRSNFLAGACSGNESLRQAVESLVQSHEETNHFIDSPAFAAAAELLADGDEFKPGRTLGHYEIHSILGEGGMGRVYLAEDNKLKRKVALKVLPAVRRGDEQARRRLLREAQAAAALDHSNICAIYEVDADSDPSYIAMQYIEGETLEARIARERLSLDDALNIAAQTADALAGAHAHNIIHRDVKPSNIMLTSRGQVKVLDFGLAKTATANLAGPDEALTNSRLTMPGMILGTVPYMSPEQVRSEPVDVRTDIFSFGVVLYEMLSGRRVFARNSAAETIAAILHQEPPQLSSIDPTIPKELENVADKCLAKDAGQRYQTMHQVAHDLNAARTGALTAMGTAARPAKAAMTSTDRVAGVSAEVGITQPLSSAEYLVTQVKHHKRTAMFAMAAIVIAVTVLGYRSYFATAGETIDSVAVLPFVNVNNDPNAEYLSDGLSDTIIDSLSQLPNLKKVISLSSVLRYKGKQTDPQTVGRELSVRAVLMGRLTQRGDDLLISAELVDVKDNKRLWGAQYDRKLADVLKLQGDIAQQISERLRLKLSSSQKQRLAKSYTGNSEAYQLYLLGRFFRRNREGNQKAIDYLEQAIKKDPNFAAAYAQLAYTYVSDLFSGRLTRKEAREKLELAIQRALEIDDSLADAHAALAMLTDDWSARMKEFQRAIELDPNAADVHAFYARSLWGHRRIDEAILHMKRAVELDPLSAALHTDLGKILYSAGQHEQAMEEYRTAQKLNPNYLGVHNNLARFYLGEGRYGDAIAEAEKAIANATDQEPTRASLGYTYAVAGKRAEAQKILSEMQELSKQRPVNPEAFALIYTGLGDKDRAFEFLQKQCEENPYGLLFVNVLPEWESLRSDPRFAEFLKRLKLTP